MQEPSSEVKKLQIYVVSDTHGSNENVFESLKGVKGDIFIHAGDFTKRGSDQTFRSFFDFLDKINFKHKIVIAGNHEIVLDNGTMNPKQRIKKLQKHKCNVFLLQQQFTKEQVLIELKKRCIYLEHESVQIQGIKIFGSPYSLDYCHSAFQYKPQLDQVIWSKIPQNVQLLVTHCPPYGILDQSNNGKNGGSKALKIMTEHRKPKYHIFGHIHQGQGTKKIGDVTYINVAKQLTRLIL